MTRIDTFLAAMTLEEKIDPPRWWQMRASGRSARGVHHRSEIGERLPVRVRNSLELVPKSGFQGNARAMARDAERMFDDFSKISRWVHSA
jgi:hypothetical protein